MTERRLLAVVARAVLSVLLAGVFYIGWMAVAIPTIKSGVGGLAVKAMLWILAPIVTGFGFALGPKTFDLLSTATGNNSFLKTYKWSLISCEIGGGVVCIFGPMQIVFGMFVAGMLSTILQEVIRVRKKPCLTFLVHHQYGSKESYFRSKLPSLSNP